jgi:hypothetical protein
MLPRDKHSSLFCWNDIDEEEYILQHWRQMSFDNLRTLAGKITRGYNFRCYATVYSSLSEHVT